MVKVRLLPRSTRWRVALLAALTSLLVLGVGSYWFIDTLQAGLENTAQRVADDKLLAVQAMLQSGVSPVDVAGRLDQGGGYLISPNISQGPRTCPPSGDSASGQFNGRAVVYSP